MTDAGRWLEEGAVLRLELAPWDPGEKWKAAWMWDKERLIPVSLCFWFVWISKVVLFVILAFVHHEDFNS